MPVALAPHGTVAAYRRHLRHGEEACAECKAANADWYRGYSARNPETVRAIARTASARYRRAALGKTQRVKAERAARRAADRWVPALKEIPPEAGDYLTTDGQAVYISTWSTKRHWCGETVTHWMPLPELPEDQPLDSSDIV